MHPMFADFYPSFEFEENERESISPRQSSSAKNEYEVAAERAAAKEERGVTHPESPGPASASMDTEEEAYEAEALSQIAAVREECRKGNEELAVLGREKEALLARLVAERLGRSFAGEIRIDLAAGAHRNKAGTLVIHLFKQFEILDGVIARGNERIASRRKETVLMVQEVLNRADDYLKRAKSLVAFVEKVSAAPRKAKQTPTTKPSSLATEVASTKPSLETATTSQATSPQSEKAALKQMKKAAAKERKTEEEEQEQEAANSIVEDEMASPSKTRATSRVPARRRFPTPKYQIRNGEDAAEIVLRLPVGFDPDHDLTFGLRDSNVVTVGNFEKPLEFAIDERAMDIAAMTYRMLPERYLAIRIPRRRASPAERYRASRLPTRSATGFDDRYLYHPRLAVADPFWSW